MSLFKIICLVLLLLLMVTAPTVAYDNNGMSFTMVASESEQGYVTIYLTDGGILIGKIVDSYEDRIKIEKISGEQFTIYRRSIKEIKHGKLPLPPLPYQASVMAGRIAGEKDAKASVNGNMWMLFGCIGNYMCLLLPAYVAYVYEPSIPATNFLDKAPEYVAAYNNAYKATAKGIQIRKTWTGCIISGVLLLASLFSIAYYTGV